MADRPLLTRAVHDPGERRIIGIELRLVTRMQNTREEVALIPCDVRYPRGQWSYPSLALNATVHTTNGDANFPVDLELPL